MKKSADFVMGRQDWISLLVLMALTVLLFNQVIIHPQWLISPDYDLLYAYTPWKYFAHANWIESGQLPFWYNIGFGGTPLLGNLSVSMFFYPLNLLFLVFNPDSVYGFLFLIHVFLAGAGMYLFLRYRRITRVGAMVGAISFMFSGHILSKIFQGGMTNMFAISLVPWIFLLFELMFAKRKAIYALLFGVVLALQFHASMIQVFFYSCVAMSLYLLFRLAFDYAENKSLRRLAKPIMHYVLAFFVCIMLSAVALLPALELAKYSTRNVGKGYEFSTFGSLEPQKLITLFIPNFFGTPTNNTDWGGGIYWEICMYIGVLSLLLSFIPLVFARNKNTIPLIFLGLFSLVFSLGKYTPFYGIFFSYVPGFNLFRIPATYLFMTVFSLAALAAYGIDILFSRHDISKVRFFSAAWKILAIMGVLALLSLPILQIAKPMILTKGMAMLEGTGILESRYAKPISYYETHLINVFNEIASGILRLGLLLLSAALIVFLRLKPRINPAIPRLLLILIVAADLISFGLPFIHTKDTGEIFQSTDLTRFLDKDTSKYRVLDIAGYLPPYIAARHDIELVTGYDPFMLYYYVDLANLAGNYTGYQPTELPMQADESFRMKKIANKGVLDLLNVKYIISSEKSEIEGYSLAYQNLSYTYPAPYGGRIYSNLTGPLYIYKNEHPLPRAYLIGVTKTIPNQSEVLEEMAGPGFNPTRYAIVEKELPDGPLNVSISREVEISYYSPNRITVGLITDKPMLLVLSEVWYPAWKAYDNGEEIEIYRVDSALRGVYLREGQHTIEFRYEPESYKIGKAVTLSSILFCIILILIKLIPGIINKNQARD